MHKRLADPVPTGIYECNSRCKCSKMCLNRVVQHPLQTKLQVFKTVNRGWGLRCLNDIPKGNFVCIYAGDLLTEQNANEAGDNFGDEYFAELDYIEVVESLKEGYEQDAPNDDDDDEEYSQDAGRKKQHKRDSDDDEFISKTAIAGERCVRTRYQTRNSSDNSQTEEKSTTSTAKSKDRKKSDEIVISDEDEERQPINFAPASSMVAYDNDTDTTSTKYKSVRRLFGRDEFCFVMDAKKTGNIGRYFNVSITCITFCIYIILNINLILIFFFYVI